MKKTISLPVALFDRKRYLKIESNFRSPISYLLLIRISRKSIDNNRSETWESIVIKGPVYAEHIRTETFWDVTRVLWKKAGHYHDSKNVCLIFTT